MRTSTPLAYPALATPPQMVFPASHHIHLRYPYHLWHHSDGSVLGKMEWQTLKHHTTMKSPSFPRKPGGLFLQRGE
jgi:hypothetical protein